MIERTRLQNPTRKLKSCSSWYQPLGPKTSCFISPCLSFPGSNTVQWQYQGLSWGLMRHTRKAFQAASGTSKCSAWAGGHTWPVLSWGTSLRRDKLRHEGSIRKSEKRLGDRVETERKVGVSKGNAMEM